MVAVPNLEDAGKFKTHLSRLVNAETVSKREGFRHVLGREREERRGEKRQTKS